MAAPAALGPDWLDPQKILDALGPYALVGVLVIVFVECGLLLGFFLPGDSLLFTAGLLIATGFIDTPLWLACLLIVIAACTGNLLGYAIGYRAGPAIFNREDSRLFKRQYVDKTHEFFERFGARAIVLARFVPIVRTFITVMAGVGRMDLRRYAIYTTLGGMMWGAGITVCGYFLGQIAFFRQNIEAILVAIVLVSVVPIGIELLRTRLQLRKERARTPDPPTTASVHDRR
jgi:membrane-associated protein